MDFPFAVQGFRELAGTSGALQRQLGMPQAQAVAQVQTGLQLQLQFWQLQEALSEAVDLVFFVFMMIWFHPSRRSHSRDLT